ncbi:MAG: ATP-grasp domain-containing protein [Pirellulales bacterium]
MPDTLTIIGASARAAAWSAWRAGYEVRAGDLFADLDLADRCHARAVADYPRGLAEIVRGPQAGEWMYTGALENHPALVEEWSQVRTLLGNAAEVLRRVRDPLAVAAALTAAGLPCPAATRGVPPPGSGVWLHKPLHSAGGAHVDYWHASSRAPHGVRAGCYIQEFIEGDSAAGLYLAAGGTARLLGVTRQLMGGASTRGSRFGYCGSVGPLPLSRAANSSWTHIGDVLAGQFNLTGLFGVDAIVNSRGIWPVEVNPRYTASAELFDWAHGISTVGLHVAACRTGQPAAPEIPAARRLHGKRIVFAEAPIVVQRDLRTTLSDSEMLSRDWPVLADIPTPGTRIDAGAPIVTVFAEGETQQQVLERLRLLDARVAECAGS